MTDRETHDLAAALECRVASATRDELRAVHAFFNVPRLRAHMSVLVELLERELLVRDADATELAHRRRSRETA